MRRLDLIFKRLSIFGLIVLVFASCGTEPEFERDNPYEIPIVEIDSLESSLFSMSWRDYTFTEYGLKLKLPESVQGHVRIIKKNGYKEAIEIYNESNHPSGRDFYDQSITTVDDFGYPLEYQIIYLNEGNTKEQSYSFPVRFGDITLISHQETDQGYQISWQKNDLLFANGFHLISKTSSEETIVDDIPSLTVEYNLELPISDYGDLFLIKPYKYFENKVTYLEGIEFKTNPAKPIIQSVDIIDKSHLEIKWEDNSVIETGYQLYLNEVLIAELDENTTSYLYETPLETYEWFKFRIAAAKDSLFTFSRNFDYQVSDLPYPEITELYHLDNQTFEIHFDDRVDFERSITFNYGYNSSISVLNSQGFVRFENLGINDGMDLSFSAELSYGRYGSRSIPLRFRPRMDYLTSIDLSETLDQKMIDVRFTGNKLLYSQSNELHQVELMPESIEFGILTSFDSDILLVRLANNNDLALVTTEDSSYLVVISNASKTTLSINSELEIYDATFVNNDDDILLSTNVGVLLYSIANTTLVELNQFETLNPLQFFGDASATRLLALERENQEIHYFNTLSDISYHQTINVDENYYVNNIDHLNSAQNVLAYEMGLSYEYSVQPQCEFGALCVFGYYDGYSSNDNAFIHIIDNEYRIISKNQELRLVRKENLNTTHEKEKDYITSVVLSKINREYNMLIEFDELTNTIDFYDLSEKWSFTNYGSYSDIVWPSN